MVEILVALMTLVLLLALAAPSLGPFINYDQRKTTLRKLEQLRAAMMLGYRDNAYGMEAVDLARLTFNGVAINSGVTATTGAAGTFVGVARYSQLSPDQMANDAYNRPVRVFVSNRLSRPVFGQDIYYHMAAVVSTGENGTLHAGTTFDAATGVLRLGGDDLGVVIDGFEVQRELFDLTFKRMTRIGEAYQTYFQSRYLSDPTRDISINYFANSQADGTASPRWDAGGTFRTGGAAGAGIDTLGADSALGLSPVEFRDGWGNMIGIDNASSSTRNPDNPTAAMQTPPYSARIGVMLPGSTWFRISINSQF